jgi:hypothetical protein
MVSSASQPHFEVLSAVDTLDQALAAVKWSQTCRIVASVVDLKFLLYCRKFVGARSAKVVAGFASDGAPTL